MRKRSAPKRAVDKARAEQADLIADSLFITFLATCGECGEEEEGYESDEAEIQFSERLYDAGWRCEEDGGLVCPKCLAKAVASLTPAP